MRLIVIVLGTLMAFLAACSPAQSNPTTEPPTPAEQAATTERPTSAPAVISESPTPAEPLPMPSSPPGGPPIVPVIEPIEVTYFTPPQGEGPYYTLDKPVDRDNDLTILEGAAGPPAGEVLEFSGKVYNNAGFPVDGAVIEIWQTDSSGVYLHPGDPGYAQRDPNFQFYGEAVIGPDGRYSFRTVLPGKYEPRPVHIHFKILVDGQVVLTSQFYFEGDSSLAADGLFAGAGSESEHLIITLAEGSDAAGNSILVGERDIILDI